jgi:hypothetical protein
MNRKTTAIAAFAALALTATGAAADHFGSHGPKGNDTGGIIPWSPENELAAFHIAEDNCARFNKFAVLRSIRRVYGDFIVYDCRWERARYVHDLRHHHRRVNVTIDK